MQHSSHYTFAQLGATVTSELSVLESFLFHHHSPPHTHPTISPLPPFSLLTPCASLSLSLSLILSLFLLSLSLSFKMSREDLKLLNRVGNRPLGVVNTLGVELRSIPDKTEGDQILFSSRERLAMLAQVDKLTKVRGVFHLHMS